MTTQHLSVKNALQYAWDTLKARPWFWVGVTAFILLVSAAFDFLGEGVEEESFLLFLVGCVGAFVQWWLYLGLITLAFTAYKKDSLYFRDLFIRDWKILINYVLATLLFGLMILPFLILTFGILVTALTLLLWNGVPGISMEIMMFSIPILLVVILFLTPIIFLLIRYSQYTFLIIDRQLGPGKSLKQSRQLTKGHKWKIFLFLVTLWVVNIIGGALAGIGLLISIPITILSGVYVYKWLMSQQDRTEEDVTIVPTDTELKSVENPVE